MISSHPAFRDALERAIQEEIVHLLQNLANDAAEDWGDYKRRIGAIQGLQRAAEMCQSVADQLEQR